MPRQNSPLESSESFSNRTIKAGRAAWLVILCLIPECLAADKKDELHVIPLGSWKASDSEIMNLDLTGVPGTVASQSYEPSYALTIWDLSESFQAKRQHVSLARAETLCLLNGGEGLLCDGRTVRYWDFQKRRVTVPLAFLRLPVSEDFEYPDEVWCPSRSRQMVAMMLGNWLYVAQQDSLENGKVTRCGGHWAAILEETGFIVVCDQNALTLKSLEPERLHQPGEAFRRISNPSVDVESWTSELANAKGGNVELEHHHLPERGKIWSRTYRAVIDASPAYVAFMTNLRVSAKDPEKAAVEVWEIDKSGSSRVVRLDDEETLRNAGYGASVVHIAGVAFTQNGSPKFHFVYVGDTSIAIACVVHEPKRINQQPLITMKFPKLPTLDVSTDKVTAAWCDPSSCILVTGHRSGLIAVWSYKDIYNLLP